MLVLTRKPGESIAIGADVRIDIVAIDGDRVRIAIEAPRDVEIRRTGAASSEAGPGPAPA